MRRFVVLTALLAACSEDDPHRHLDGGIHDAPPMMMIDAPATPQPVTLTITQDGAPKANVRVYFQGSDSSLVSNTLTDASGVASAIMDAGGYVTAIQPFAVPAGTVSDDIRTFAGVKPGDHLVLHQESVTTSASVTFTAPVDPDASVASYMFSTKCSNQTVGADGSGANPQATLYLYGDCATAVDIVVASLDVNNAIVHYFYAPATTVTGTAVDLTAKAYDGSPSTKTYTYTNFIPSFSEVNLEETLSSTQGAVALFSTFTTGGTATQKLPAFTNAVDTVDAWAYYQYGMHSFLDWGPFASTLTVDVGARALTETTSSPAFDATNHRFTWTPATGGQAPDFAMTVAYASRTTPLLYWRWQIASPYTAGLVQFPVLPVETGGPDYNFGDTDSVGLNALMLAKVPGGYDAVRAVAPNLTDPRQLVASGSGSVTAEEISQVALRIKGKAPRKLTTRPSAWQLSRRM